MTSNIIFCNLLVRPNNENILSYSSLHKCTSPFKNNLFGVKTNEKCNFLYKVEKVSKAAPNSTEQGLFDCHSKRMPMSLRCVYCCHQCYYLDKGIQTAMSLWLLLNWIDTYFSNYAWQPCCFEFSFARWKWGFNKYHWNVCTKNTMCVLQCVM